MMQLIIRAQNKLLEMQQTSKGFKLFLFETQDQQTQMQASQISVDSLEQIKGSNKYFSTVKDVKDYIRLNKGLQFSAGKIEINFKHPVLKEQVLKIGTLDLQKKEKLSRQDYDYINRLCMSDKPLESNDLKSILLRVSQQLEYLSPLREKQVMQVKSPFAEFHLEKKEGMETVERQKQSELEILRGVFQKKIQALAFELQKNRQIMFDKFEKIDMESQIRDQVISESSSFLQRNFMKIGEIEPGAQNLNIIAKVIDVKSLNNDMVSVILGDQTAIVKGAFKKNPLIQKQACIVILKCQSRVVKQHIQIQLQHGGKISPFYKIIRTVNKRFDISYKSWVPIDR